MTEVQERRYPSPWQDHRTLDVGSDPGGHTGSFEFAVSYR